MIVIADSSPLIILAKIDCFVLLQKLYSRLCISTDVHHEVVIAGAGLPGASDVASSPWIEVKPLKNPAALLAAYKKSSIGIGELSTIYLGKELKGDELLLDDYEAREMAKREGFRVRGSVGLLELSYRKGYLTDLRGAFQKLLTHNVYIDRKLLEQRLRVLNLSPL